MQNETVIPKIGVPYLIISAMIRRHRSHFVWNTKKFHPLFCGYKPVEDRTEVEIEQFRESVKNIRRRRRDQSHHLQIFREGFSQAIERRLCDEKRRAIGVFPFAVGAVLFTIGRRMFIKEVVAVPASQRLSHRSGCGDNCRHRVFVPFAVAVAASVTPSSFVGDCCWVIIAL